MVTEYGWNGVQSFLIGPSMALNWPVIPTAGTPPVEGEDRFIHRLGLRDGIDGATKTGVFIGRTF